MEPRSAESSRAAPSCTHRSAAKEPEPEAAPAAPAAPRLLAAEHVAFVVALDKQQDSVEHAASEYLRAAGIVAALVDLLEHDFDGEANFAQIAEPLRARCGPAVVVPKRAAFRDLLQASGALELVERGGGHYVRLRALPPRTCPCLNAAVERAKKSAEEP